MHGDSAFEELPMNGNGKARVTSNGGTAYRQTTHKTSTSSRRNGSVKNNKKYRHNSQTSETISASTYGGNNGTVGHDFVMLSQRNGLNISGEFHTLRGQTISSYRIGHKEDAITFLGIKFDQPDNHIYTPSDTISGAVILDIDSPIVIRGVELKILGIGTVMAYHNGYVRHRKTHTYLDKRSFLMGRSDAAPGMIKPGHYTSQFKYKIPAEVPSSVFTEGVIKSSTYKVDVSYVVQAMVIDDVCVKNGNASQEGYQVIHKPIKIETREFRVAGLNQLDPDVKPVHHEEAISSQGQKAIQLNMDYTVLQVGKELNIHIDTDDQTARNIKQVKADLLQLVVLPDSPFRFRKPLLNNVCENYHRSENICTWDLSLLTTTDMPPSYNDEPYLASIKYILKIGLKLPNKWMNMEVPITLRSVGTDDENIPIFRTVQRGKLTHQLSAPDNHMNGGIKKGSDVKVEVYYNNSEKKKGNPFSSCMGRGVRD